MVLLLAIPVVDVKVTLFDGSYHDVILMKWRLKLLVPWRLKKVQKKQSLLLFEPIMKVEVVTPEDYMGDVMGDLNRRSGILQGMDDSPSGKVDSMQKFHYVKCLVMQLILRSMTQGRATYTMEFSKYNEAPANIAEQVIE